MLNKIKKEYYQHLREDKEIVNLNVVSWVIFYFFISF